MDKKRPNGRHINDLALHILKTRPRNRFLLTSQEYEFFILILKEHSYTKGNHVDDVSKLEQTAPAAGPDMTNAGIESAPREEPEPEEFHPTDSFHIIK